MFKELDYEPIEYLIYHTCECNNTISMHYEGQFDECPFCNRKLIENKRNMKG